MLDEILDTAITMILDAIESFFNALVYPTSKHLVTAIYTSMGFLVFSLVMELIGSVASFVSWQEALTCTIILFIIYGVNSISQKDINRLTSSIKDKAGKAKSKVTSTVKSAGTKKDKKPAKKAK